jgi:hypothetical protein
MNYIENKDSKDQNHLKLIEFFGIKAPNLFLINHSWEQSSKEVLATTETTYMKCYHYSKKA